MNVPIPHLDPDAIGLDVDLGLCALVLVGGSALLFLPITITLLILVAAGLITLGTVLVREKP